MTPAAVLRRGAAAVAAASGVLAALSLVPPVAAQEQDPAPDTAAVAATEGSHTFLGGYALLAYDPATGQLGVAAASGGFSAGSTIPGLRPDHGAVAVLGRTSESAGRRVLDALREGRPVRDAVEGAVEAEGRGDGLQLSALTPGCRSHTRAAEGSYPWTGTREGTTGSLCYRAAGAFLADSTVLDRLVAGFSGAEGGLLERLHAGLSAAERATGDVAPSRSAVIWIAVPDAERGPLGRAELRLQLDDVQRPADALRYVIRAARADALSRRASRAVDDGRHEEALELAEEALELEGASALAWLARGRALLYLGRDREAEEAFQRMLEVNPYLLHLLGDPRVAAADTAAAGPDARDAPRAGRPEEAGLDARRPEVRQSLIPYRPRLILRLDTYRRAFFREVDFPRAEEPEGDGASPEDPE